jgi:hypothetical protein
LNNLFGLFTGTAVPTAHDGHTSCTPLEGRRITISFYLYYFILRELGLLIEGTKPQVVFSSDGSSPAELPSRCPTVGLSHPPFLIAGFATAKNVYYIF